MGKRVLATDRSQPESAWRERFVRYAASKQTVEAFCLSEAVSVASFYGWRTRLRNGRGNVLPAPRTVPLPAASPFIDLGSVKGRAANTSGSSHANASRYASHQAPHHTRSGIDVRLELGDGLALHIARH